MFEDIRQQVYRSCALIDRAQYSWVDSVFHPDARITAGAYEGQIADFVDILRARRDAVPRAVHMIGNLLITPIGPDRAFAESYCHAIEETSDEEGRNVERAVHLRYADLFRHDDRGWRIAHRTVIVDLARAPVPAGDGGYRGPQGRRDENDPALMMLNAAREAVQ